MGPARFPLPPLRQELRIDAGAPLPSGAPAFVLFDPLRHVFFQLGEIEQRIASYWRLGDAFAVRDRLIADGQDPEDAEAAFTAFHGFAVDNSLLRELPGEQVATLAGRREAARHAWWRWLLDHYLFVRIPLVRPAAFLARTLPYARKVWSRVGVALLVAMAACGAFLVTRQWDVFAAQFRGLLSVKGLFAYAGALLMVKICHELGHAYMATRNGVRVPSMGVSLLVMVPVLYTDTTAAWRLPERKRRIQIDAAGVMAELSVAAVALFAWSFLPDGPVRTGAFVLATTSLATSLLVNASPFMRFDGYYILSDLLGVPNLATRAFALMRWRLRETLFALHEPPPERLPARISRAMLAYAVVTFCYRTTLYLGIATFVYHHFFKALGVVLFGVEVCVFLGRPVYSELRAWRARAPAISASPRGRWVFAIVALLAVAAFLPLDRSISVPALLTPMGDKPLVVGDPAQVRQVFVRNGDAVAADQPILILSSPEIALGLAQSGLRIAQLESQVARAGSDRGDLADTTVLQRDLLAERLRLAGLQRRQEALTVRAPIAGRVLDIPDGLAAGAWTDGKQVLARVTTPERFDVEAYAPEDQAWRLKAGATGRFVPRSATDGLRRVRLDEIGASAVHEIDQTLMATGNGGPIETVGAPSATNPLHPKHALIALHLVAEQARSSAFLRPETGHVVLPAQGESVCAEVMRSILRIFAREGSLQS